MEKKKKHKSLWQAVRFGVVGVINTLVDYGVFFLLIAAFHVHKGAAQVVATGVSMCGSFLLNRRWTFKKRGKGDLREIVRFVIINLLSMATAITFTHWFYDILHLERGMNAILSSVGISFVLTGNFAVMFCKFASSAFSLAINFFGNKFWVFGNKQSTEGS